MALLGAHVSAAGGLPKVFSRAEDVGAEALQLFTKNQLQWHASPPSLSDCQRFFAAWRESSIRQVIAHASYLINLAAPGPVWEKSVQALVGEIERCDLLGIDYLVLHPGSHKGTGEEKGLALLSRGLERALEQSDMTHVRVLLETMAGQGSVLGASFHHFSKILQHLPLNDRIGFCLDTCHMFAAGYEFRFPGSYEHLMQLVEKTIGCQNVYCIHFNDSKEEKGSKRDRHEHIGDGKLGIQPFSLFISDPRWENTPCLLETPKERKSDSENLALLRKLRGS
ncbi:MAG: deoxyribonuclease IV [Synergistales bacterium]|nr:deoxyribonuclease IV [Synergistales bacterium]